MALKSAWAQRERTREMKAALSPTPVPAWGVVNGKYAVRKSGGLQVVVYSNRKQAEAKVIGLRAEGLNCKVSERWPFTIEMIGGEI